jgi:hypothetical protein
MKHLFCIGMAMYHIRRSLLFIGLAAVCSFVSCKKEELPPGFDMLFERDFSIPAGIGIFDVHHFYIRNVPTQIQEQLTRNGLKMSDIKRVITTKASLDGTFGDADYAFIEEVSVRAFDEDDETKFIEVAYRQPVPLDPGNSLPLIPSLADSKSFFTASRVSFDISLRIRVTTSQELDTRISLQMRAVTE